MSIYSLKIIVVILVQDTGLRYIVANALRATKTDQQLNDFHPKRNSQNVQSRLSTRPIRVIVFGLQLCRVKSVANLHPTVWKGMPMSRVSQF